MDAGRVCRAPCGMCVGGWVVRASVPAPMRGLDIVHRIHAQTRDHVVVRCSSCLCVPSNHSFVILQPRRRRGCLLCAAQAVGVGPRQPGGRLAADARHGAGARRARARAGWLGLVAQLDDSRLPVLRIAQQSPERPAKDGTKMFTPFFPDYFPALSRKIPRHFQKDPQTMVLNLELF